MKITVKGAQQLQKKLDALAKQGAKRAMRKATTAGATVLLRAAREEVPVHEGLLKKAQDKKVTTKNNVAAGIVGGNVAKMKADAEASGKPNRGAVARAVHAVVHGKGKDQFLRPANIDWLVNNGHVTHEGQVVPPNPYLQRAAAAAMPEAERAYAAKLAAEIEKEASRS